MPETPNPAPKPNAPGGKPKGPGGIPVWGWILGAVAGLFIGIIVYKKSSGSAANTSGSTDQSSATSPSGSDSGTSAGGAVASPPADDFQNMLQQLGLVPTSVGSQTHSNFEQPAPPSDATVAPNYSVDTSGSTWAPASQPLQTITPITSTYTIPTSSGGQSAPISTSTGHGPQLTG